VREFCDAKDLLPTDLEDLTRDQLMLMIMPKAELARGGKVVELVRGNGRDDLAAHGLSKTDTSLVQRVRERKSKDSKRAGRRARKQRLKAEADRLAAARAEGLVK